MQTIQFLQTVLPVLTLIANNSVLPCMSLVTFKLLPQCWSSEWVSLSNSMCEPFNRNIWGSRSLCLIQPQSLLVLTARSCGASPPSTTLGWEFWCGAKSPLVFKQGSLLFKRNSKQCGTSPSVSLALLPVSLWLPYTLSFRTHVQLRFRYSILWSFCSLL